MVPVPSAHAAVRGRDRWCDSLKRGTAEQWIKEGKQAVKMTRLSCHRFRSNEVHLWLSVIAYSLGNCGAGSRCYRYGSFHSVANRRGGCTMVPFSRSRVCWVGGERGTREQRQGLCGAGRGRGGAAGVIRITWTARGAPALSLYPAAHRTDAIPESPPHGYQCTSSWHEFRRAAFSWTGPRLRRPSRPPDVPHCNN
jgi:hypothetical protein